MARLDEELSRRDVLRRGVVGLTVLVGLGACKKKETAFSCTDTHALAPEEMQARTTLAYVDTTPEPGKECAGCQQFVAPPSDGQCGGCKVVKGPIHPRGYCKVFAPKA
jgi:hypothetical protein